MSDIHDNLFTYFCTIQFSAEYPEFYLGSCIRITYFGPLKYISKLCLSYDYQSDNNC